MGANIFAPYIQQPKSVLDYVGEAEQRDMRGAQLQGLQRQNALAGVLMQQQMGDVQDKQARRNALQRVLSDPLITTPQAREEAMFKDPLLMDQGQAAQKARLDAEKLRADTSKSTAEADEKQWGLRVKKANTAITDIAALGSRDEAIASLTRHYQAGDIDQTKYQSVLATIPQDAAQFPAWRKQMLLRILDAKEQLEATKPVLQTNNTGGETVTQAIDPLTGVPTVTGRLKNTQTADNAASNARMAADARAAREQSASQFDQRLNYDKEKDKAATTGGANITEGERNAGGYAARMTEASKLLDQFEGKGRATYKTDTLGGVPLVGRSLQTSAMTAEQQQYRQAQEDWVRAKLRKESGASIAPDEMAREISAYFPEPGDRPENIAQKKQARAVANQAMVQSAGRGAPKAEAAKPAAPTPTPKPGAVLRFDAQGNPVQ